MGKMKPYKEKATEIHYEPVKVQHTAHFERPVTTEVAHTYQVAQQHQVPVEQQHTVVQQPVYQQQQPQFNGTFQQQPFFDQDDEQLVQDFPVQDQDDDVVQQDGPIQQDDDVVQQPVQQPVVYRAPVHIVRQAPVHVVRQAAVHVEGATQYQQQALPLPALPAAHVQHYQTQTEQTYTTEHPVTPETGYVKYSKNYTTTKMVPVKTHTEVTKYKPVHHEVIIDHNITQVHYVPVKKTIEVPE